MVTITINTYFWFKVLLFVLVNILVGYVCYRIAENQTSVYYNQIIDNLVKSGAIPGVKLNELEEEDPKSK